jgi:thioredoxin-related protein
VKPAALRRQFNAGLLGLLGLGAAALWPQRSRAQGAVPSPHAIDIPRWFSNSLLDFKDEIPEAAREGKRVMVYFGQDGCPYCKALMKANFGPGPITDKTRQHFTAIAINIWGDLDVTWVDGTRTTEKGLARLLNVQFTPTLLFFETDGRLALRLNGYQPPERFTHVLDYVIARRSRELSLAEYLNTVAPEGAAGAPLAPQPYLMADPTRLARAGRRKPLAVLFEAPGCKACGEMHGEAFQRAGLRRLLRGFDVARLQPGAAQALLTPDGRRSDTRAFARDLGVNLYPTVVFFDAQGREAFRFDGYMRPFHIESAFDYVASGAYQREPQFQRFVQARAEALERAGQPVDLWR